MTDAKDFVDIEEFAGKEKPAHMRCYRIRIDEEHFVVDVSELAGRQILALVKKDATSHRLFQKLHGGQAVQVPDNQVVSFLAPDIERFLTKKLVTIVVNGRPKQVEKDEISFDEVVILAFGPHPGGDKSLFTVTYKRGHGDKPEGYLVAGQTVRVKEGMIFNVTPTNKSVSTRRTHLPGGVGEVRTCAPD